MIEPPCAEAWINHNSDRAGTEGVAMSAKASASDWRQPVDAELDRSAPVHMAPPRPPTRAQRLLLPRPNSALFVLAGSSLAFMAALGLRETAVRAVPPLARAYAAIGLPVNLRGLEIHDLTSSLLQDASGSVLTVEGKIVNIRPRAVAVPPVRIGVEGSDGHEIYTWTTAVPKAWLAEGETIDFRARLTTPPADAHTVLVKFAALPN
jgi:hypothetical protein